MTHTVTSSCSEADIVWQRMFARQMQAVRSTSVVSQVLLDGIRIMDLDPHHVPNPDHVSAKLYDRVGWVLSDARNEYLSHDDWFDALIQKQFPVTSYIRPLVDIDYTPLPDLFHEYFGHMPQMFQQFFADIEYKTAQLHQGATDHQKQEIFRISRWTIEYGVVMEDGIPKAIGAGILSSPGDLQRFVDGDFQLETATLEGLINTKPSPHSPHETLFVCESPQQWHDLLDQYQREYMT